MDLPPFLFLLFLLISCTYPHPAESRPHNNHTDLEALLAFKANVVDPLGVLSTNWTTNTSFCGWMGITCSRKHQRVTALTLRNITLQGTLSPHLGNLSFLSFLLLSNNALTGPIPHVLTKLPRLRTLVIQKNYLTGSIPFGLFNMSSLVEMWFPSNYLSGSLPLYHNISVLPRLQVVALGMNQLTGQIPTIFAHWLDLQVLDLGFNNFSGTVPDELGYLPELEVLYLGPNQLIGKIPSSLGNLTNLIKLQLSFNKLEGEIPDELGNLSNLQHLKLGENSLTGSIPSALTNASMIQILGLNSNHLTGPVPAALGEYMPLLEFLALAHNRLTGTLDFTTSLSNCRNLVYFALHENVLEGSLPSSIGNLSVNLQLLDIGQNRISGIIPAELGNLSSLLYLDLGDNELMGGIPSELTKLHKLQSIYLHHNKINGSVPSELSLMTSLGNLYFEYNQLSGTIPNSLGNLTGLQFLSLTANNFSSSIPLSLWSLGSLIELNLSQNAIQDSIPLEVSNLNHLDKLDLSGNQLSGNISAALGELEMLTYLDLSSNSFHGQIPQSVGGLISIKYLNFSKNFLSGVIPKSLANLRYLGNLDLSFNMLGGQIPKGRVFSNLSIASLEGNIALCGAPQLDFPPCSANSTASHSKRKLNLLKYILPVTVLVVLFSCGFLTHTIHQKKKAKVMASTNSPCLCEQRVVSYHELVRATNNFSHANLLGRGGSSSVFKGHLDDGLIVAIKVLNMDVEEASKNFDAECQALSKVRHRNLIKIISICLRLDFKALILEYMPNGSLEYWLYSENCCLNLLQRLNIMVDVSTALEHLHHHHPQVILHCDLKPSNILLDEEMVAHVSDFGIAKLLLGRSVASASTPGTIGYIAPEYGCTGKVSKMGDVYSFGILLLATFTGKKPTDGIFGGESSLREWICEAYPTKLFDIVDGNLLRESSLGEQRLEGQTAMHLCLSSIIELGLLCSSYSPNDRILMIDVVPKLHKIKVEYLSRLSSA